MLFMKLLPRLAGFDAPKAAREFEDAMRGERTSPLPGTVEAADVDRLVYRGAGLPRLRERHSRARPSAMSARAPGVAIELVRRGTEWLALDDSTTLAAGDEVVISAPVDKQMRVREVLGPEVPDAEARALRPAAHGGRGDRPDEAAGRSLPDSASALGCIRMRSSAPASNCRPVRRPRSRRAT